MNLHNIKLVVMILILFMAGCTEKDDLTRLVRIRFKIGFTTQSAIWESGGGLELYSFTEGWINIQKIQFEGKREAGEDVYFETDPDINLPIIEFWAQPNCVRPAIICDFDIPQGIYDNMEWDITMKKIVTDKLIADDDTDSLDIGLVIKGSYNDIWGDSPYTIRILFAIDDTIKFSLRSYPRYGNPKIVISENRDNEAILFLDLYYAFNPISRESIEEAEISSDIDGEPILIISCDKNKQLYENLLYRISQSAKVYVQ